MTNTILVAADVSISAGASRSLPVLRNTWMLLLDFGLSLRCWRENARSECLLGLLNPWSTPAILQLFNIK